LQEEIMNPMIRTLIAAALALCFALPGMGSQRSCPVLLEPSRGD
jgi:hypothetical protein